MFERDCMPVALPKFFKTHPDEKNYYDNGTPQFRRIYCKVARYLQDCTQEQLNQLIELLEEVKRNKVKEQQQNGETTG